MGDGLLLPILRGSALLWTLLVTALIGNVIALNVNAAGSATAAINYCMFVAVLSWIATLLGLATSLFSVGSSLVQMVQLALDALATLFSFVAAVVLAAKLTAVNCANLDPKDHPADYIAWGSNDNTKRCREIQASDVFLWFLWATFIACAFFTFRDWRRSGGSAGRSSVGAPSMAQFRGV